MERGRSKDPGKQERLDNYKAQFKNGKKKWVRYDEGAILYSMGSTRLWIWLMRRRQFIASSVSVL